jgi:hypothetical protein
VQRTGLSAAQLGRFTEFSQVEAYRAPGGSPAVTETYLLAVLDVGLMMMNEVGRFRKRTDSQFMFFSEFGDGLFLPEESVGGRGWGHMDIQATRGSCRSSAWAGISTNGPRTPAAR